ncbi:MAG TPA: Mut7-C RNAse domain-containing protein [Gammaproteobacteria bacterium]
MAVVEFRFYEELNEFLTPARRRRAFDYDCAAHATVKHAVEALGVPHTEIELILVNGESVDFSYRVTDGDRISVYPQFEALDVTPLLRVRARPLRNSRFIADAHLGALAKYLRAVGFDTLYRNDFRDREVAAIAAAEHRIVLTRDRALLMQKDVTHGCFVRSTRPLEQLEEVLARLDLFGAVAPFTRCLVCNTPLRPLPYAEAVSRVPDRSARCHDKFYTCEVCTRVYWAGSHTRRLGAVLAKVLAGRGHSHIATTE